MRERKHEREHKRQRGQYMTPESLAQDIVSALDLAKTHRILEPSCGDGSFIKAIAYHLTRSGSGSCAERSIEVIGIEIDATLAAASEEFVDCGVARLSEGVSYQIFNTDFFRAYLEGEIRVASDRTSQQFHRASFDLIVGNPPFGGTFDHEIEDALDSVLGRRLGRKIKKETYSFFIVACLDLLRKGGKLVFVCSDTILTIPTMTGLRQLLMEHGEVTILDVEEFSDETSYPMVVLQVTKGEHYGIVTRNGELIDGHAIRATRNLSWGITPELAKLFHGPLLGDLLIASSGMTTGKNEYFVREVSDQGCIEEPYEFSFYDAPVTVAYEQERARLGKLSTRKRAQLAEAEVRGATERRLHVKPREEAVSIHLPDSRYKQYNKANNRIVFSPPTHFIYWENDGEAVLTYKKTGNWYLRGVGGQPYFGREGLTWQLVASRFAPRFLPEGYILDSGAPCAFVRNGTDRDELFFVLAWLLSPLASRILKTVINHTRNIQSKDFERMPYPWWVASLPKADAIARVRQMIDAARSGTDWAWKDDEVQQLGRLFNVPADLDAALAAESRRTQHTPLSQMSLFASLGE